MEKTMGSVKKGYIVFDLDGTIVFSHKQVLLASRIVLNKWFGHDVSQDDFDKGFHKNPVKFIKTLE